MDGNSSQEAEIAKFIKARPLGSVYFESRPKDFMVYKTNNKWEVKYTISTPFEVRNYKLQLKRGGNRRFATLDAVEICLRKIGVTNFEVVLKS